MTDYRKCFIGDIRLSNVFDVDFQEILNEK